MKSTLTLFSSARRRGNTGRLIDRVAGELGLEVVDLGEKNIAPYTYDHLHRGDDFEPLMTHLLAFEQLIFASPVYWYSVSPAMKVFLDRISDYLDLPELLDQGRRLRGKTGFVLCTSIMEAPDAPFIDAFRQTFEYLGMRYGGYLHANCVDGYMAEKYEGDVAEFLVRVQSVGT
jgi:multimeric flavodoxin WrbA